MPIVDANNDVLLGIKITAKFVSQKNIMITKGCHNLIDQIQSYSWDPKAADRGEDKPVKVNDHATDALRYACASAFPTGELHNVDENLTIDQLRRQIYGNDENVFLQNPVGGYY